MLYNIVWSFPSFLTIQAWIVCVSALWIGNYQIRCWWMIIFYLSFQKFIIFFSLLWHSNTQNNMELFVSIWGLSCSSPMTTFMIINFQNTEEHPFGCNFKMHPFGCQLLFTPPSSLPFSFCKRVYSCVALENPSGWPSMLQITRTTYSMKGNKEYFQGK